MFADKTLFDEEKLGNTTILQNVPRGDAKNFYVHPWMLGFSKESKNGRAPRRISFRCPLFPKRSLTKQAVVNCIHTRACVPGLIAHASIQAQHIMPCPHVLWAVWPYTAQLGKTLRMVLQSGFESHRDPLEVDLATNNSSGMIGDFTIRCPWILH